MIDTHTHVYLPEFAEDVDEVIARARQAGVTSCWLPGIDQDSLPSMLALKARHDGYFEVFAGLHPTEVGPDYARRLDVIGEALADTIYKGIGEIGLDLYWDATYRREQEDALRVQLDWAVAQGRPVLLHVRQAYDEIMPIVRTYYGKGLKGIFHCFAGTLEQARELTGAGFLLGINGSITYKNTPQRGFIHQIPLKYIVTETDAPYLSPVPLRGRRNEPAHVALVVACLASLYGLTAEEVARQTEMNARGL